MEELKYKSLLEFLNIMATTATSDAMDENYMSFTLKYLLQVPATQVVCGIVYGLDSKPLSIHEAAKAILNLLAMKGAIKEEEILKVADVIVPKVEENVKNEGDIDGRKLE
jgi:hypothetical protein